MKKEKEVKEKKKKFHIVGDEFNKKSTRYQTKRSQEITEKNLKKEKLIVEYKSILDNADLYDEDFIKITKKRYKSIHKVKAKVVKPQVDKTYIPFLIDSKSTVYIQEEKCFSNKWIELFGKETIENRINSFKKLLHLKPDNTKYWNPFN